MRPPRRLGLAVRAAALALGSFPSFAAAPPPAPAVPPAPPTPDAVGWVVPAAESVALNLILWRSLDSASDLPDYSITWPEAVTEYPARPWKLDGDDFVTNQFSHPYHGASSFTAARSMGVPFWPATLYPALTSLSWELFLESQNPSTNDQIATTWGGVVLGEALHRAANLTRGAGWRGREVGAFVFSPASALNRLVFPRRSLGTAPQRARTTTRLAWGVMLAGDLAGTAGGRPLGPRARAAADLDQWAAAGGTVRRPFDRLHLSAELEMGTDGRVTPPETSRWAVQGRGQLIGLPLELPGADAASWGLEAGHLYEETGAGRVSTEHLGLGIGGMAHLAPALGLRGGAGLAWVPWGSALSMDTHPTPADWFAGPSGQGMLDLGLDLGDRARLDLATTAVALSGASEAPRREWFLLSRARAAVRVAGRHHLELELEEDHRRSQPDAGPLVDARARYLRLTWAWRRGGPGDGRPTSP